MALYSSQSQRSSTDRLLMPPAGHSTWNCERSDDDQPPRKYMYTSVIPFPTAGTTVVPVVYYLSRNGQLHHPHFILVPLSSSLGLFLKDVLNKLNFIRGNGMAHMYSWSSKRSYKNGYVWQDLGEDDLIQPTTDDQDYILKGSELLLQLQPQSSATTADEAALHCNSSSTHHHHRSSKSSNKNQFDKYSTIYDQIQCRRQVYKSESSRELGGAKASADMATQTERRRSKSMREEVYVNKSSLELSRDHDLSPPSLSTSHGHTLDGVGGSGDVDRCACVLDPTVHKESTSARIKPSRVWMQLFSCGSTAKDCSSIKQNKRGYSIRPKCGRTVLRDTLDR